MSTPWRPAAWMMVSPSKAEMVSPFSLKSMVWALAARSFIFMCLNLVPEVLHDGADRVGRGLSEPADRCVGHGDRELLQQLPIPLRLLHELHRLGGPDAAWRALPARLVLEELHEVHRGIARAV